MVKEEGHPRKEFIMEQKLTIKSSPIEFFESFLPVYEKHIFYHKTTVGEWTTWTNTKALLENAGQEGFPYPDWKPFTVREIKQFLTLFILQGLLPSPRIEMKFSPQMEDPVNGNNLVF